MMYNWAVKFLYFLSVSYFSIASAYAETFTIGVEDISYSPYSEIRNKEYKGFAREVFDLFAKKYDHKITYVPLPVARLTTYFLNGKVDFKYPDHPKWAAEKKKNKDVKYSSRIVAFTDGVLVLEKNLGKGKLKDLGTMLGFAPFLFLNQIKKNEMHLNENVSLEGLIEQVRKGRIDGAFFNVAVAEKAIDGKGYKKSILFDPSLPHVSDYYHLSTINKTKILESFNKFLKENEEEVRLLKAKYRLK